MNVRSSEWILGGFLAYAAVMAAVVAMPQHLRLTTIALNSSLLAGYALLVTLGTIRSRKAASPRIVEIARDWLPLGLTLLAYREMGWFAQPHVTHTLEARWVVWDRVVLRGGGKALIESLGPVLPSVLEIAYLLVYALGPFSVAMLYVYGRRERVDRFLFLFLLAVLACYAQFPFWPSEPPRVVFPTDDLPAYTTVFRGWNLWLLGKGGIHTGVFPSGHVTAAFAAAIGMCLYLPEHKWVGRFLMVTAILVAAATVYGRYHYLVDAVAGLFMAALAWVIVRYSAKTLWTN